MKIDLRALLIAAAVGAAVLVLSLSGYTILVTPVFASIPGSEIKTASDATAAALEMCLLTVLIWPISMIVYFGTGSLYAFFHSREPRLSIVEGNVGGSLTGMLAGFAGTSINHLIGLLILTSPPVTDPFKLLLPLILPLVFNTLLGGALGGLGGTVAARWIARR